MFSSRPINCVLILDRYINDWNDDHTDEMKKWSKRLKSSIEEDDTESKHKRLCLSSVTSLTQLLDIYSDVGPVPEMDDILAFINKSKPSLDDIGEFRREINSIVGLIDNHNFVLEHHLHDIRETIDELSETRLRTTKTVDTLNVSRAELHELIEEFRLDHTDVVNNCQCKHDDADKIMEAWQEMHKHLKLNNRSHVSCRKKINQYLTLLDQFKSEKLLESELVDNLNMLHDTKYSKAMIDLKREVEIASKGKLSTVVITKLTRIIPNMKFVYRADIVIGIKQMIKECFINTNKYLYSQEF
jgi:hypothetical protein